MKLKKKVKKRLLESRAIKLGLCPVCGEELQYYDTIEARTKNYTTGVLWWHKTHSYEEAHKVSIRRKCSKDISHYDVHHNYYVDPDEPDEDDIDCHF